MSPRDDSFLAKIEYHDGVMRVSCVLTCREDVERVLPMLDGLFPRRNAMAERKPGAPAPGEVSG